MTDPLTRVVRGVRQTLLRVLPDALGNLLRAPGERADRSLAPAPITAPQGRARLLIAPANFAAQGIAWARAVDRLDDAGAHNMEVRGEGGFGFAADYVVPASVFTASTDWSRRHAAAVADGYTHVLVEAARPVLGARFGSSLPREVRWLRQRGIATAFLSHGSDLRLPSRHAALDRWSPFQDASADWVRVLEAKAQRTRRTLQELGGPVFVATPELLGDWPDARWLPNVVDARQWRTEARVLDGRRPIVLHAPTNPNLKGTALIEPVLHRLHAEGVIDYRRVERVPASQMPQLYAEADVVLDQFALGIYSTTSIEAMASGRLVVAHLHDQVVDHVREITGETPPVVSAAPDALEEMLRDVTAHPGEYRELAAKGPAFVERVHDGSLSASVLRDFLEQV